MVEVDAGVMSSWSGPQHPPLAEDAEPAPGFVAVVSNATATGSAEIDDLPGQPAWPDLPSVRLYGGWPPGEARLARRPSARLLVVGHCLASSRELTVAFDGAVRSGDFATLRALPGAFTCLVVDRDELLVVTDIAGQYPVYYSNRGAERLVGMHPGVVAARHGRSFDPVTAAARIACPSVLPLWSDRSPYRDVRWIGGGALLRIGTSGVRLEHEPTLSVPGTTREHAAPQLRAALVDAVRLRCDAGSVSADLSGGLDSTSLALLAASHSRGPVRTVTYHHPLAPAADLADAVQYARFQPAIEPTVVNGTEWTLPYGTIPAAPVRRPAPGWAPQVLPTTEPFAHALAWRRSALRLTVVASWGTRAHLTGEGGDAVLGGTAAYLADLVVTGSVGSLLRHSMILARLRHTSPSALARRAIGTALTPPSTALRRLAAALRRPGNGPVEWRDTASWWPVSGEAVSWLAEPMRRHLAEVAADAATVRLVPANARLADLMTLTELRHSANSQRYLRGLGHRMGLAVHAPYLDGTVVQVCLRVPASQRVDPRSAKPMLRLALANLVPDRIFERRSKGDYTGEDYRGARRVAPRLRGLLHDPRLADLGVIEPSRARESVERLLAGASVSTGELNQLLATELWLGDVDRAETGSGLPW